MQDGSSRDIVVPVMGPTGAGKSTFINALLGNDCMAVGHRLTSGTTQVAYTVMDGILDHRRHGLRDYRVVIVDTPGLGDTYKDNEAVMRSLLDWLKQSYPDRAIVGGVVYLHDVSNDRFSKTAYDNLQRLTMLCEDISIGNIILGVTKWERVSDADSREIELKESHWKSMIDQGSQVRRLANKDRESALECIYAILDLHRRAMGANSTVMNTVLQIQKELASSRRSNLESKAGKELRSTLRQAVRVQMRIFSLETEVAGRLRTFEAARELEEKRAEMRRIMKGLTEFKSPFGWLVSMFLIVKSTFGKPSRSKVKSAGWPLLPKANIDKPFTPPRRLLKRRRAPSSATSKSPHRQQLTLGLTRSSHDAAQAGTEDNSTTATLPRLLLSTTYTSAETGCP